MDPTHAKARTHRVAAAREPLVRSFVSSSDDWTGSAIVPASPCERPAARVTGRSPLQRNFSRGSALIEFADRVFDMLAQETPLVGRHVAVTLAFFDIGRDTRAQHRRRSRRRESCSRHLGGRHVASVRMTFGLTAPNGLRLRMRMRCAERTRHGAGNRQRDAVRAHARPRSYRHLVPFVMRQPATSNYVCRCWGLPQARERSYGMKYPPKSRDQ